MVLVVMVMVGVGAKLETVKTEPCVALADVELEFNKLASLKKAVST